MFQFLILNKNLYEKKFISNLPNNNIKFLRTLSKYNYKNNKNNMYNLSSLTNTHSFIYSMFFIENNLILNYKQLYNSTKLNFFNIYKKSYFVYTLFNIYYKSSTNFS